MKALSLIPLLLICLVTAVSGQEKWREYYNKINKAELAICDSNFIVAGQYYADAFIINSQKPFSKDLCNAFFTAMDAKQYQLAEKYLSQLLARGLGKKFIKDKILKSYTGESKQRIISILAKYHNNDPLASAEAREIKQMVKLDQGVREYFSNLNDGAYMVDSTFAVDERNASGLMKLFKTRGGIPSEAVPGYGVLFDDAAPVLPDYNIILLHNTAGVFGNRPAHIFDTMLCRAVFSLDFQASSFGYLIEYNSAADSFRYGSMVLHFPLSLLNGAYYKGKIYPEYYDKASEQRMDAERAKIGLPPLNDLRKKIEAANAGGITAKYLFLPSIRVQDLESETALRQWLEKNGKDAPVKKSVFAHKHSPPQPPVFDVGVIGDYVTIGKTLYSEIIKHYKGMNKEYYQGEIPYDSWKNKKLVLPWNYHAELIKSKTADLPTDSDGYDQARFLPGYNMLIENAFNVPLAHFSNIELLFCKDTAIRFKANTDTGLCKALLRIVGPPGSRTEKRDTVTSPWNARQVVLSTRKYIWQKGSRRSEFIIAETLSRKGQKEVSSTYYMTDEAKYAVYLKQVEGEYQRLKNVHTTGEK